MVWFVFKKIKGNGGFETDGKVYQKNSVILKAQRKLLYFLVQLVHFMILQQSINRRNALAKLKMETRSTSRFSDSQYNVLSTRTQYTYPGTLGYPFFLAVFLEQIFWSYLQ